MAFALDAIQVRRDAATPELRRLTELSAVKAALKLFSGTVATLWMASGLLRLPSRTARLVDDKEPVIVGR